MAQKFNRRRRNDALLGAIDIGSSKIACFIARAAMARADAAQAEIIGVGYHGSPVRLGRAMALDELEMGVRCALDAAERMAGERIHQVSVIVPGRFLKTRRIGVEMEIPGGLVTNEDVRESLCEGANIAAPTDCAILYSMAARFKVDDEEFASSPVGLTGSKLSTEMLGVSARQSVVDNLGAIFERCGVTPEQFIAAPYAAAEATLIEDEKDLGVVLIDIGAASTGYAVYDNGMLVDCGGVSVGGAHITKDIAQIFGMPLSQAERIKTLHGAGLIGAGDENRFVEFQQLGAGGEKGRASRADFCDVILPRLEEIFELVAKRLPDDGLRRSGLRRAVITGGGSLLVGAREVAEQVLSMKTRLGRPIAIAGAPEAASAPGFAACCGAIQTMIISSDDAKSPLGVSGQSLQSFKQPSMFGGVEAWLRARF